MKVSARYRLSKKQLREVRGELEAALPGVELKPGEVEYAKVDGVEVYIVGGVPCAAKLGGRIIPLLTCLLKRGSGGYPALVVDRGAARAVARGADLMAPGVVEVRGEFKRGDIVLIVDSETGVPVAVAEALEDSGEVRARVESRGRGKVAKTLHRPGDRLWRAADALRS